MFHRKKILQRRKSRYKINYVQCSLEINHSGKETLVELINLSQSGALIRYTGILVQEDDVSLYFKIKGETFRTIINGKVKHCSNHYFGIDFDYLIDMDIITKLINH